jgi:polysaccharide biosynthesis transport protein
LGLVLGLLLGIGVALVLDAQKDVIYTPGDLKRITPVPILGIIPHSSVVETGYDEAHLLSLYQVTMPPARTVHWPIEQWGIGTGWPARL